MLKKILLLIVVVISIILNIINLFNIINIRFLPAIYLNILFWGSLANYSHYKGKPYMVTGLLLLPILISYLQTYLFENVYINLDFTILAVVTIIHKLTYSTVVIIILLINYEYTELPIFLSIITFQLIFIIYIIFNASITPLVYLLRQVTILFLLVNEIRNNKEFEGLRE